MLMEPNTLLDDINNHYLKFIYVENIWLVVFNVPLTARSFRDGTPIYCPLHEGREARFLYCSHRESIPGSLCGSPLHYRCATQAPHENISIHNRREVNVK